MINTLVLKIKRRETRFWQRVYDFAKAVKTLSVPSVKVIHLPLYYLHTGMKNLWDRVYQGLWAVPLFKARCKKCGKGLKLPDGMPLIMGSHLQLEVGDDVTIIDSTLASGHVFDEARIVIGDRVNLGYHSDISAAKLVTIGSDTVIAKDCYIADNDGHPIDPQRRRLHQSVNADEVAPVHIGENVWIGTGVYILKGVTIGNNSIIAANSVVTHSIPDNVLAAGVPAKVIKQI